MQRPRTPPSRSTVLVAVIVSGAGHVVHNLAEFPVAILLGWETLVPVAITALLAIVLWARPGQATFLIAGIWAGVVLVIGGGSVLPLDVLPFAPEQSVSHYLAHVAYAASQVPLLWVAYWGLATENPDPPPAPALDDRR